MALLQPYVFGSGLLWIVQLTDVNGNTIANPTPQRLGVLQEMQVKMDAPVKNLYGQYYLPVASGRGEVKPTVTAKFASVNMGLLNSLFFGEPSSPAKGGANQVVIVNDEAGTIPGTPFQVTVANAAHFTQDLGVRYTTGANAGQYLTAVASSPATGQYSVASGVYTFAAADTTLGVSIDYAYADTASSEFSILIANHLLGSAPQFKAFGKATFAGTSEKVAFQFNQCISDTWGLPTKLDDFMIMDASFSMYADASNNLGIITGPTF